MASPAASLPLVGGKGANLTRLVQAGFRVPAGFLITTEAYAAFVAANGLAERIAAALPTGPAGEADRVAQAASQIRALFAQGTLPAGLAEDLLAGYAGLGRPAVAVRSSATAEDLPDMSFAGQQDTYLNVVGEASLLDAVVACWGSLWTARAIGYRVRNGVPHTGVALAVVVQQMVESQAAGVLFTANPLTGLRTETVIDATLGLGEALVSGQVEPDHYVVDRVSGQITTRTLGTKALAVRSVAGGGTVTVAENAAARQALPDAQVLALAGLGQQVAALYGAPQDIEWAWADEMLYLLQARPITSLFPLPAGLPPLPLQVMFSFAAVQGLLDPLTPFGQDILRQIFASGARVFGLRRTRENQRILYTAGERLWINATPLMRSTPGRAVFSKILDWVEPTIHQAVNRIWDEPQLQPARRGLSRRAAGQLARFVLPLAWNVALNLAFPERRRAVIVRQGEAVLDLMRNRCAAGAGAERPRARLAQLAKVVPATIDEQLPPAFILYVSGVAAGMAAFNLMRTLAARVAGARPGWDDRVLAATRGLPHNPTTEMDLALWQVAQAIRHDPPSWPAWQTQTTLELTHRFSAGALPAAAQNALARFLAQYGARGLAEFDMGRPRWEEDPGHVFEVLAGYLQIADPAQAPEAVFARGAEQAQSAIGGLEAAVGVGRGGWLNARLLHWAAGRTRALLGLREVPKFFAVRMMGIVRRELLAVGQELAQAGELTRPDDLFYLSFAELAALADGAAVDWPGRVALRREAYRRELLRRQIPRLLLSDGRAFYEGLSEPAGQSGALRGSPVAPGIAEGLVRIVRDPRHAGLLPGEILVCPGTDPSWTPLFLIAAGLVMEVGGMMTHGAVVAREYGIPAIVGVDRATERLRTGQRVRVDGSSGQVLILDEGTPET